MPRPIFAHIDLNALRHNLAVARTHAKGRALWAVVKANAYGHGLERVMTALAQADGLALLDFDEARRARDAGWRKPILLLEGFFSIPDLTLVDALGLTAVVHHTDQVRWLLEWAKSAVPTGGVNLYLKVNTGMNRLGLNPEELPATIEQLSATGKVRVVALMTHFANADSADHHELDEPLRQFNTAVAAYWRGKTSLANSASLLMHPQVGGDSVRPGIMLYGASPMQGQTAASFGLKPVMRLYSELIAVRAVKAGQAVGYGGRWVAPRDTRIGVVACGYADGYPRIAADGTPVWVQGHCAALAGRVSMDMITVDLAGAPQAQVGSRVELWGEHVPIDAVAQSAGTVGYELMCALAPRVPISAVG
ncbi:MAG TPA: alanine racemase [Burkholderiaceae bacterium]|nr:alanine racemase [Burkholderiaceae bacterium]